MWTGGVVQSIPGSFIMWLPCYTIDPLGLITSKHKWTPMMCTAYSERYSTPGTIISLLSIMHSPAAGIKPLLVSRSTTQNCDRNKPTNDLNKKSVERIDWISWPQNGAPCKAPDCTADIVPVGTLLKKDSTSIPWVAAQFVSTKVRFLPFSVKTNENDLHRKYRLLCGTNLSPLSILQITQSRWFHYI